MSLIYPAGVIGGDDASYRIARSLRFNPADTPWLTRTPAVSGDQKRFTVSLWCKKALFGASPQWIFHSFFGASNAVTMYWNHTTAGGAAIDGLAFQIVNGTVRLDRVTTAVFRDPAAWYHICWSMDTTPATPVMTLEVNGIAITSYAPNTFNLTQNEAMPINAPTAPFWIGRYGGSAVNNFGGYLAEVNYVDGSAQPASAFAQTNVTTGQWEPKAYTGLYGVNGCCLKFADNSNTTAATLGKDSSPNGNNWTPSGLVVTAGIGNDSLTDTPTNYGNDTGAGGEVRGNYCVMSPLDPAGYAITKYDGNLVIATAIASNVTLGSRATFAMPSGKWYWEYTCITRDSTGGTWQAVSVISSSVSYPSGSFAAASSGGWSYYNNAFKGNAGVDTAYGATWGTGDVIGVALDMDVGTITFYKNGVSQTQAYSGLTGSLFPAIDMFRSTTTSNQGALNFGQRPFAFAAPSGFKALCTQNLPTPAIRKPSQYFDVNLRTATSAPFSVTGKQFQPDLVWVKSRNVAASHSVYDSSRGVQKDLKTNLTDAEITEPTGLTAFNADGFSGAAYPGMNLSPYTYVDWMWKKGAVSGFDIQTVPKAAATNEAFPHSLGVAPRMMITKARNVVNDWIVWHADLPATNFVRLNLTDAVVANPAVFSAAPTSTQFFLGTAWGANNLLVYLFTDVPGFSKIGSYNSNNAADGPFVWCGFRPRWLLVKNTSVFASWNIFDGVRGDTNVIGPSLYAHVADTEISSARIDFLSNGFKLRTAGDPNVGAPNMHIYAAFAEAPFKYARAR